MSVWSAPPGSICETAPVSWSIRKLPPAEAEQSAVSGAHQAAFLLGENPDLTSLQVSTHDAFSVALPKDVLRVERG